MKMRKLFEDVHTTDFIEFQNDGEHIHFFIICPDDKEKNHELLFNNNQILEMIAELSKLLISK